MKIAVAKDEAFNFTYKANIDALKACAEVEFFSPLNDREMPQCDLLYLPGGYPELFAGPLEENQGMRKSIQAFAEEEGHVLAECGGMMYLTQSIQMDDKLFAMCGVIPLECTMEKAHLHLGYRSIPTETGSLKGHEFHYSEVREIPLGTFLQSFQIQQSAKGVPASTALYHYKNVIAGYTHWYWAECGFQEFLQSISAFV